MAETDITGAFGSVKSEKGYLNARLDVQSARNKLFELNKELTLALRDFNSPTGAGKNYQAAADAVKSAQAKVDQAKQEVIRVESLARADYQQAKRKIDAKKDKTESVKIQDELDRLNVQLQRAKDSGQSTAIIDTQIRDLTDKKNKTGKYAPVKETQAGGVVGDQGTGATGRDYLAEQAAAFQSVDKMKPQTRELLAKNLKAAGFYKGPITGIYTDALAAAYQNAIIANSARSTNLGREIPWDQFLSDKITENNLLGGAGGPSVSMARSISTKLEAASRVEDIFKTELGRMPTPEELDKYSAMLIAKEKKESSYTKTTTRKVGGISYTDTTQGLDRNQYLQNQIRKLPEYDKRKAEARSLTVQSLQSVANDNGVTLSPQQLDQYALEVQGGKDVKVIQNQIRALAGLGMPENVKKLLAEGTDLSTIYSPYKKAMAAILEINPETISLSDPVLRSAIGPNGEMSLYDYQRQLRKDPRWQYTSNAREDVSTAALQVLRDFGFQG